MNIYPAIDIRDGQVVRLRQGDPNQKTVYSSNPAEVAQRWKAAGAGRVHVVNLDGALDEGASIWPVVKSIVDLGLKVQFGGGLRTADNVKQALKKGVSRVVLGTMAVENPGLVEDLLFQVGADSLVVALDARDGIIVSHGWQTRTEWQVIDLARAMKQVGVRHVLYTDTARDGEMTGVNLEVTCRLARETGLQVIASGGVRSLEDVRDLAATGEIAGVILGRALYEGQIDLAEALRIGQGA